MGKGLGKQQPCVDRKLFHKTEKPKAMSLSERRRIAHQIQKDRQRTWDPKAYDPVWEDA